MTIEGLLAIRDRERSDILGRIVADLKNDQRVGAAWLHGSLSRGDHDGLSDIDLTVVVADESANDFINNRWEYSARAGRPVLVMDNFANAPADGAYLLVFYAGEVGPQHVDWFWQPESTARIPDDEKILFNRLRLPVVPGAEWRREQHRPPGPRLGPSPTRVEVLTHEITFFWAMSLIVAKSIARGNGDTVARMILRIGRTLTDLARLVDNNRALHASDAALHSDMEAKAPTEQFRVLYELAREATSLHDDIVDQSASIPLEAIPHIYRFFELTHSMATARM